MALISIFGVRLDNPVTPWVVLALVAAGWLFVYLWTTRAER